MMKCPDCGSICYDYFCKTCDKELNNYMSDEGFKPQAVNGLNLDADLPRPKNLNSTLQLIKKDLDHIEGKKNMAEKAGFFIRLSAYFIDSIVVSLCSLFLLLTLLILMNFISNNNASISEVLNSVLIPFCFFSRLLRLSTRGLLKCAGKTKNASNKEKNRLATTTIAI